MPHPATIEETYDWHVKRILGKLKKLHADNEESEPFDEDWLNSNLSEVGGAFLDDLLTWSGIQESIDEMDDD